MEVRRKVVDTAEYVGMLKGLVEEGQEVSMLIAGNSMSPFMIHERDSIAFRMPDRALRVGDMVFYQRVTGQYVMHRIYKITAEGYFMVGDAQMDIEGPLSREQIFAIVTKVRRKGKWIGPGNFWWEFFEKIWIRIVPYRRSVWKLYSAFARLKGSASNNEEMEFESVETADGLPEPEQMETLEEPETSGEELFDTGKSNMKQKKSVSGGNLAGRFVQMFEDMLDSEAQEYYDGEEDDTEAKEESEEIEEDFYDEDDEDDFEDSFLDEEE